MSKVLQKCDMCFKQKLNVDFQPSRSQLLFGGFNKKMENRCPACERKVIKWVDKMIKLV